MRSWTVRDEATLGALAEDTRETNSLIFAVIVDASPPVKTENYSNYSIMLKVVDPSFNYRCRPSVPGLTFYKHAQVYIFVEAPEEAPPIRFVGDIIRLRRFRFEVRDKGDMRGFQRKNSTWYIFGGQKDDPFRPLATNRRSGDAFAELQRPFEIGRLSDLRYWSDHFFFSNFLCFAVWWRAPLSVPGRAAPENSSVEEKERDLIVRCVSVDFAKREIVFQDRHGTAYRLVLNSKPAIAVGDVLQLKSVDIVWRREKDGWEGRLALTKFASCLRIPPFSCDRRIFTRMALTAGGALPPQPRPSLELFQPAPGAARHALTAFRPGTDLGIPSSIPELRKVLEEEPQKNIARKFFIEAEVGDFHTVKASDVILRYYPFEKHARRLDEPVILGKKHRIIYNILFYLRASKGGEDLPVYIVTNENEFYMFDGWGVLPANDDTRGWMDVEDADLAAFSAKLARLRRRRVALVVQLMMTVTHKYFFKVVDTVFLPFK